MENGYLFLNLLMMNERTMQHSMSGLTEEEKASREKAAIQNVNWLIDHPDQKPDEIRPDGQLVFHFRGSQPEPAKLKEISVLQFDRLAKAGAEKIRKKTGKSLRQCIYFAHAEILKRYSVKEAA